MSSTLIVAGDATNVAQRCFAFQVPEWIEYADAGLVGGLTSAGLSNLPGAGTGCVVSPDGKWLACSHYYVAGYGGLTVFNLLTNERVTLGGGVIPSGCYKGGFSPDSSRFVVGCDNSPYMFVYNTTTWARVTGMSVSGTVYSVAFNPSGTLAAVAHFGGNNLTVYNTNDWSQVSLAGGYPTTDYGFGVAFSPDGTKLVFAHDSTPFVTMYDTTTWARSALPAASLPASNGKCIAYSPDGTMLAVGVSGTPYLLIYDTTTWARKTLSANPAQVVTDLAFSPDNAALVAVSSWNSTGVNLNAYTVAASATRVTLDASITTRGNLNSATFAPNLIDLRIATTSGAPVTDAAGGAAARKVRAYARENGVILGATTSAANGSYSLGPFLAPTDASVIFIDDADGDQLNDLVIRAKPG
jgi:WD40 repeat protein